MRRVFLMVLTVIISLTVNSQIRWYDPFDGEIPQIQGRAWNTEIGKNYHRFPDRAKSSIRNAVWNLSTNSTGLSVSFYCNAPEIIVKLTVSESIIQWNMPSIASSGVDLYVTDNHGITDWCACPAGMDFGKNIGDTITFHYKDLEYHNYHKRGSEYQLFLPLLNEVTSLKIGIPQDCELKFAPIPLEKPIVVYGTSISQGIAASRPAMAWSNIIRRRTDSPVINLGFSGNGRLESPVFDLISEIDAQMYIIDCMPNMYPYHDSIVSRMLDGVKKIRNKSQAPILLVENDGYMYGKTNKPIENECIVTNLELKKAYSKLQEAGIKNIYYLTKEEIGITSDAQVDGWHASDVGMTEYANAYVKKINEILNRKPLKVFEPCRQRREPDSYEWAERHQAVMELNRTTNPEIVLIGNSITHYWAGQPIAHRQSGPKSWKKLFGKRTVTNMGFGWDRIENVFWRIYHGELDECHPKHIFLMIGTNNLEKNTNEEIISGIIGLAELIKQCQPDANLHVIKIYPRRNQEKRIANLNQELQKRLVIDGKMDLLDATSQLILKDGSGKVDESLFLEGLHPNEKGYKKIANVLKPVLK